MYWKLCGESGGIVLLSGGKKAYNGGDAEAKVLIDFDGLPKGKFYYKIKLYSFCSSYTIGIDYGNPTTKHHSK